METQLGEKIRKRYRTVKAVGLERTDARTYVRTNESEFIGSFRSLKTSGEPIKKISRIGKLDNNKRPILVEFSSEHDKDLLIRGGGATFQLGGLNKS